MISAQILTKNNETTIEACLQSVGQHVDNITVVDLGSTDETCNIVQRYTKVIKSQQSRDSLRTTMCCPEWNIYIEPWEILHSGSRAYIEALRPANYYVSVLQEKSLTKAVRLWHGQQAFENPVFESIKGSDISKIIIRSSGRSDYEEVLKELETWKAKDIRNPSPYYYQACLLFGLGRYEDFLRISEHYMFLTGNSTSMSSVMNRYYFAMAQLIHRKSYKPALQNINLCLCAKPLMAEFWCLMADVYYHLLRNFKTAKEFYENAIILGANRLQSEVWPMDITKYKSYPNKMIASCDVLLNPNLYGKTDVHTH